MNESETIGKAHHTIIKACGIPHLYFKYAVGGAVQSHAFPYPGL